MIFNFILWYYSLQLYFSISWFWDGQLVAQCKLRACIKINTFSYSMLSTGSPVFGAKDCWIHPLYHYAYTIIGLATPVPMACDLGVVIMNLKIWGWQWWRKIHHLSNFIIIISPLFQLTYFGQLKVNSSGVEFQRITFKSGCSLGIRDWRILHLLHRILLLACGSLGLFFMQMWSRFQNILL